MSNFFRYKRFEYKNVDTRVEKNVQEILNDIVLDGWEIVNYSEKRNEVDGHLTTIVILCGKKQNVL